MNSLSIFNDLFSHMAWADALMWRSVLKYTSSKEDAILQERLHHIHLCQRAWLLIWRGDAVDPAAGKSLDIYGLSRWAYQYHQSLAQYINNIQASSIETLVTVPGVDQELPRPSLWETFIQIATHSTYHRGQVSARLREIGGEPSETDFIKWVFLSRPAAEWPLEAE